MTIHEDARRASEAVYDTAISEQVARAEKAEDALAITIEQNHALTLELRDEQTTNSLLNSTIVDLRERIAELESQIDNVPPGWVTLYDSTFGVDDGWTKNQETQSNDNSYNTPANVSFGSRGMVLLSKRQNMGGRPYTTADVLGRHIAVPNYFRAEVTATLPTDYGQWPCPLWFRPLNGNDGEIDVVETWPHDWNGVPRLYVTLHDKYSNNRKEGARLDYSKLPNPDPAVPHTYVVEKVKDRITFSVDGVTVYSWEKATINPKFKLWFDTIFENPDRTWYPRMTTQMGEPNARDPKPEWNQSEMIIHRLRIFKPE